MSGMNSNCVNKEYPILYNHKKECCGCSACFAKCPRGAIVMAEDEEGFFYPQINKDLCVKCYQCMDVCPLKGQENGI